ncbi:hypothetical protein Pelo_14137 [Pelomyxa schiedti]|nr:hypothetical protein Pelo_14137 [Pelomyxa schiedti]
MDKVNSEPSLKEVIERLDKLSKGMGSIHYRLAVIEDYILGMINRDAEHQQHVSPTTTDFDETILSEALSCSEFLCPVSQLSASVDSAPSAPNSPPLVETPIQPPLLPAPSTADEPDHTSTPASDPTVLPVDASVTQLPATEIDSPPPLAPLTLGASTEEPCESSTSVSSTPITSVPEPLATSVSECPVTTEPTPVSELSLTTPTSTAISEPIATTLPASTEQSSNTQPGTAVEIDPHADSCSAIDDNEVTIVEINNKSSTVTQSPSSARNSRSRKPSLLTKVSLELRSMLGSVEKFDPDDPTILNQLEEMGFKDKEMNASLMESYNGYAGAVVDVLLHTSDPQKT